LVPIVDPMVFASRDASGVEHVSCHLFRRFTKPRSHRFFRVSEVQLSDPYAGDVASELNASESNPEYCRDDCNRKREAALKDPGTTEPPPTPREPTGTDSRGAARRAR